VGSMTMLSGPIPITSVTYFIACGLQLAKKTVHLDLEVDGQMLSVPRER
jgi:hypothetical protein